MASSDLHTIAERYARALFAQAAHQKASDAVEADLQALQLLLEQSADLRRLTANPLLPRSLKAQVMAAVLKKNRAHAVTVHFMQRLAMARRLQALSAIVSAFHALIIAQRGEIELNVISATPLADAEASALGAALADRFGRTPRLSLAVDPSLLGGLIVQAGGQRWDYSLKNKLSRLAGTLKTRIA